MDTINQFKAEVSSLVSENASIGVVVSENQSLDALAAALSLHLIFQDSGKNSQIVSRKDPTVEHSFLVGIDQILKNFSGTTKTLTVSFPYHDGDIEKVSYNIEGDRLNVNLFAEETGIRFTEKDIRYIRQGSSPELIFTIGVSQMAEIQDVVGQSAKIINIDISQANGMFGSINIVGPAFSSLSEIVAKLAQELQLQVEFDVAQNLLDGLSSSTQNFTSPKVSPLAFEMTGFLMQKGAIRKNMKDARPQSNDTSLQMLGQKPGQNQPKQGGPKQFQNGQKFQPKPQQPINQTQSNQFQQPKPQQPQPQSQPQPVFNAQPQQPKPLDSQNFGNMTPNSMNQGMPFDMSDAQDPFASQPMQPQPQFEQPRPQPQPQPQYEQPRPQQPSPVYKASGDTQAIPNPQAAQPQEVNVNLPSEDEAPDDWFTPKVFKSTKN